MTTLSRIGFSAAPTISSLVKGSYISAVSKKVMPFSNALRMIVTPSSFVTAVP